jgi:hypothetical protein
MRNLINVQGSGWGLVDVTAVREGSFVVVVI